MRHALQTELDALASPERAALTARYFKTGPGQYGAGDRFLGVPVPQQRALAKKFRTLPLADVLALLQNPMHEYRAVALFIWVLQFQRGTPAQRTEIFEQYLTHLRYVNNWDLVDNSARDIVGGYLFDRDRRLLDDLAGTPHLWTQRIAVIATFYFIQRGQFSDTLRLIERLLPHPHDLMHKACGWMLREIGKRDTEVLREFLDEHTARMPRTMLRYAIERLPERERRGYLMRPLAQ
jgi:3-methyladenine DNA glycosylase AlkD